MIKIGSLLLNDFPLLLAPMEDVSDPPFRALCKKYGADLMFTEFISSEGLIRNAGKSTQKLDIYDEERPMGIQIFGAELDSMIQAAAIAETAKPELIDINFGCPVKKVVRKNAGAAILKDINKMVLLATEIVKRVSCPVTVKTRLGWDQNSVRIVEVAERLQDCGIQAITIHARTRSQMYKGQADWNWIKRVKENPRLQIPVFGNGDITSPLKAAEYKDRYGPDGIMIGRASIGHPWIFKQIKHYLSTGKILAQPLLAERIAVCKEHLNKSLDWKGDKLGVLEMRRHYSNYFKGYQNIKPYRNRLVTEDNPKMIIAILDELADAGLIQTQASNA